MDDGTRNQSEHRADGSANHDVSYSHANLRDLIESSRDTIWSIDRQYKLLAANAAFQDHVRLALGRPLHPGEPVTFEHMPEHLRAQWLAYYDRVLSGESFAVEARVPAPQQSTHGGRFVSYSFFPIYETAGPQPQETDEEDAAQRVVGATIFGRDSTDRAETIEAMAQQQRFLTAITETTPAIIYVLDLETRTLVYVNSAMQTLLGYDDSFSEGVSAEAFAAITHPDDVAQVLAFQRKVMQAADDDILESEYRVRHADGTWRTLHSYERPFLRNPDGSLRQKLGIAYDVSEAVQRTAALRESEEQLQALYQAVPIPAFVLRMVGDDFEIVDCNRAAEAFAGGAGRSALGHNVSEVVGSHADFVTSLRRCARTRETIEEDVEFGSRAAGNQKSLHVHYAWVPPDLILMLCEDVTERAQTIEDLRDSEARFRQVYDHQAVGVARVGLDMIIRDANQAYCSMLGYSEEELIGKHLREITHPETVEENLTKQAQLGRGEIDHYRMEKTFVHRDGHTIHGILDANLIRDARGNPVYFLGSVLDITARRMMEQQLRQREAQFRNLVEQSPVGILVFDMEGHVVQINKATLDIWGLPQEITPELVSHYCVFEDPEIAEAEAIEQIARAFEGELVVLPDFRYDSARVLRSLGLQGGASPGTWTRAHLYPVRGADCEVANVVMMLRDVSEHKAAEIEHERLTSAIEQAAETIVITDIDANILYVNPAFVRTTGYTRDEVYGQNPRILKSGVHDEAFYREMWETLVEGRTWHGRLVNRGKDGQTFTEDAVISPVRDAWGRTLNYVSVRRDVTQELHLEQQLRQAVKLEAVGRLAGGVAHDFNNMLLVILGHCEMALELVRESDEIHDDLLAIRGAAERSASLTKQLLGFARRQTVVPVVLDLNRTVVEATAMLRSLVGEAITLRWRPGHEVWPVRMDPTQVHQILTNICLNARDAIKGVGTVAIETNNVSLDQDYCARYPDSRVGDDGSGMSEEVRSHIFEPFYTTKEVGQGTGLGLATVYGIVRQNDGFVNVYSEEGLGTTLRVYLPRYVVAPSRSVTPVQDHEAPDTSPRTILLVEDEEAILRLARVMLEKKGYQVLTANSPSEAMQISQTHEGPIHLLITDVIMPEMNGRSLARRLAADRPDMRNLYMSGYTADAIAEYGLLESDMAFLSKPFTRNALLGAIDDVLAQPL